MYSTLLTDLTEGIYTITINRPDKLNALNKQVIGELSEAISEVYVNHDIRCALITGAGPKAFVAGADISEFAGLDSQGGTELARRGQEQVFDRIEASPKPIIAAVNGFALGGGCELAMACHFRIASENARFGQPEVNLGLIPGYGGTQRLTQLIGKGKAMELMMTGNMLSAAEALQLKLVNQVVPAEALLPACRELLKLINSKAPLALEQIIRLANMAAQGQPDGYTEEMEAFGQLFTTADAREGTSAFLEKRKANFTGQ